MTSVPSTVSTLQVVLWLGLLGEDSPRMDTKVLASHWLNPNGWVRKSNELPSGRIDVDHPDC